MSDDPPLRLILSKEALIANWRWLKQQSHGADCGAAVKADGYGLGAEAVIGHLRAAGCRDFFVATWAEAAAIGHATGDAGVSVLHGARAEDMAQALASSARPVLNTAAMVARWKAAAPDRPCDVMIDTGMNRLGLSVAEAMSGLLDGVRIETLMSHLACADETEHPLNIVQCAAFRAVSQMVSARRCSLANSAGIALGSDYCFGLTRPGLALYGGIAVPAMRAAIRPVAAIEAQILQVRAIAPGQSVGYGATFSPDRPTRIAIANLGYADGYLRAFAGKGFARAPDGPFPLAGRVSMDLIAVDIGSADLHEGDWLPIDYDLEQSSRATGLSQYELLTGLGGRYQRMWK